MTVTHLEFWKHYASRKPGAMGHCSWAMHLRVHRADETRTAIAMADVPAEGDVADFLTEARQAYREANPDARGCPWAVYSGGDDHVPKVGLRYRFGILYAGGRFRRG